LNILQITKYFYPAVSFGGPVQCTYNLSKYLASRGHKVVVYTTDAADISSNSEIKEKHQKIDGVEVFYFHNIAKLYDLFISPAMIRSLSKNVSRFDIVHLHEYRTFQNLAFYYQNRNHVPYALSCHGEFLYLKESWNRSFLRRMFERSFGQKLASNASKMLAVSEYEAAQYSHGGISPNKIAVIPNGVTPADFSNVTSASNFRKSHGLGNELVILYLGRLQRYKGIDNLMKAFASFSRKRTGVKLVVAGPDDNGHLETLQKLAGSLDLAGKVVFTGSLNREQVLAAYSCASVVAYVSAQEGFPIVPLEAGIMGKPLIVSDIAALDFTRSGKFALTVKYGDITQLEEALETILSNPELLTEMGENGKRFVMDNYSWDVIGKRIEDIYYGMLH
jgi:glycosyltransferase involved in cell wall biosynthesis